MPELRLKRDATRDFARFAFQTNDREQIECAKRVFSVKAPGDLGERILLPLLIEKIINNRYRFSRATVF